MSRFRRLDLTELSNRAAEFDACITGTPEIDHFCSSTAWTLSAHEAFHESAETLIVEVEGGFVALMIVPTESLGRAAFPLEATWGMASPIAAPNPEVAVPALAAALQAVQSEWDTLCLLGLRIGGRISTQLMRWYTRRRRIGLGTTTRRCVASLEGGWEGFASRRSPKFRKNARNTLHRCARAGVSFEELRPTSAAQAGEVFERVVGMEARSWKGLAGAGIAEGRMRAFYAAMFPRIAERSALRVGFAVRDGADVAYIAGGLCPSGYRGLQVSFDDALGELSLGAFVHLHTIRRLCADRVPVYDLGQDMEYKHRWGERIVETRALVVL